MSKQNFRTIGAITGLVIGILLMRYLGMGGVMAGAIFGAGGTLIGSIAGERIYGGKQS